ncbi:PREDICTED: uncharacterized protein LOC108778878 [Cyphomyrmex costatus]|uniref:uncharacterized protein LOC108778878 n=1 Tax=Cyphomyrmex costatus TaxID=456900 RepID=UPI00085244A7|nr:PREDICTED: uncharacterized protein LOC108778878 [Cyphomyrmex costatus]
MEFGDENFEFVQTCGVCEQICNEANIKDHDCLDGYSSYIVNPKTLYFYPLADDGVTIVRRSNVNNTEQLVQEPFYHEDRSNIIQIPQSTDSTERQKISEPLKKVSRKYSKINENTRIKLNFDDEELLILEVQKRPSLWDYSLPLVPSVIAQLEERKLKLDLSWSDYNTVQARMEALDDSEANDRPGFEDAYFALSAKIREKLVSFIVSTRSSAPSPALSSASDGHDSTAHVRLPKLNLPTFSVRPVILSARWRSQL